MIGSKFYVSQLPPEDKTRIIAMVNIDSLGLSSTKVWANRADKGLAAYLLQVSEALNLPVAGMNLEEVGDSDSSPFLSNKVPAIDFHSITQETFPILHSPRDSMASVRMDDYYDSYRLLVAYLAFLDSRLPEPD